MRRARTRSAQQIQLQGTEEKELAAKKVIPLSNRSQIRQRRKKRRGVGKIDTAPCASG
jgi:hypothetical protein